MIGIEEEMEPSSWQKQQLPLESASKDLIRSKEKFNSMWEKEEEGLSKMFTEKRIQMALGKGLIEKLRCRGQEKGQTLEGGNAYAGPELRGRD